METYGLNLVRVSFSQIGRAKMLLDSGRAHGTGSCAYADRNTSEVYSIGSCGIFETEECYLGSLSIQWLEMKFQWRKVMGNRLCRFDRWS